MKARRKILPVPFSILGEILRGEVEFIDLPRDAEIVGVNPITMFHMAEFVVESKTYPSLNEGDIYPRENALLRAVQKPIDITCRTPPAAKSQPGEAYRK